MSLHRFTPLSCLSIAAFVLAACATNTSDPQPSDEQPAKTTAELALIAEAQAATDMTAKVTLLAEADWQGGDFAQATIEHSKIGDAVAVHFTHDEAHVDLVYTRGDDGAPMALLRPADEASGKVLEQSISDEDPGQADPGQGAGLEAMTPAELGTVVGAPEPEINPGVTDTLAAHACGHLFAGQTLHSGEKLWSCKNGYALYMQPDGNLVLYAPGSRPTWSSKTNGKGGYRATMQNDGNFVVYNKAGKALWASGHSHAGDQLDIQDDGNLVKNTCGDVSWSTGTYCESGCVGVCTKWSCSYISKEGNHPSCFALSGNPFGRYHIQTVRTGRTVPGFCGTGTYADWKGDGISCPTSHVVSAFICD